MKKEIHVYLPPEAEKYLTNRAKKEKRSMTNMVVMIIEEARISDKSKNITA